MAGFELLYFMWTTGIGWFVWQVMNQYKETEGSGALKEMRSWSSTVRMSWQEENTLMSLGQSCEEEASWDPGWQEIPKVSHFLSFYLHYSRSHGSTVYVVKVCSLSYYKETEHTFYTKCITDLKQKQIQYISLTDIITALDAIHE